MKIKSSYIISPLLYLREKRAYKRIPVSLQGELFTGDIIYAAFITDVSESGLSSIITPLSIPVDVTPKSKSDIKVRLDSGEIINLSCEKRWSRKIGDGFTKKIGMEIINAHVQYKNLLITF